MRRQHPSSPAAGSGESADPARSTVAVRGDRAVERSPVSRDVSAGGVVFRRDDNGLASVALVGRIRPKRWSLPKGRPQLNETIEETAVREVSEETGLHVRIVQRLDEIHYWFVWGGIRHYKTVHFFLMEMMGGDTADHDAEYDVVAWFPIATAQSELSYPNEARMIERAREVLGAA